ncbi:alpha-1,3-arabinosyltransferase XAT3-like [Haliotis rufescens]|uniref:alpha-1,3-arabinosyltransferase XAT3-like n=1 Tax=Haliotis rufescens TaxID=6454 RepID=UPI00201FA8CA|nr:alpha-1,3-arabinosyltransferase XAT3-like [Haliotis rufescens]
MTNYSQELFKLLVFRAIVLLTICTSLCKAAWPASNISPVRGHYPPVFCKMSHVLLDARDRVFRYKQDLTSRNTFDSSCGAGAGIWSVRPDEQSDSMTCDETYDEGYVFTMYFYYGSNYFHLHYDMMIPLFSELRKEDKGKKIVLMPSVESVRLQAMYWETKAFHDTSKYWYQMLKVLASSHTLLPLDDRIQKSQGNICFKTINFGTPMYSSADKDLIIPYVQFIKEELGVRHHQISKDKVGIIKRTNRRRILNEGELVEAVSNIADVELVDFSRLSFKQQIEKVQEYSVLVGMNGAGLMNGLFLSPGAVTVQLVPFRADLNFKEFGQLLKNRGPYLEWHNEHANLSQELPNDPYHGQSDTTVQVGEFVELIKKALQLVNSDDYSDKTEL